MSARLVLFFVAFIDMIGLTMIVPILPFFARDAGASATTVGLLISAFSLAQLVVAPVWGRSSDRYGRRPVILAGLVVTALAYVIFAFAQSVELLLISRIIQGLGGGTIGVVQAYVADASPPAAAHAWRCAGVSATGRPSQPSSTAPPGTRANR